MLLLALATAACTRQAEPEAQAVTGPSSAGSAPAGMSAISAGYASGPGDWVRMLGCWRDTVAQRLARAPGDSGLRALPVDVNAVVAVADLDNGGAAVAAAMAALAATEARLGLKLPRSYADFVRATAGRGWFVEAFGTAQTQGDADGLLWPVQRLARYADADASGLARWLRDSEGVPAPTLQQYYRYGYQADWRQRQDSARFDAKALPPMIVVGALDQGAVVLLNPAELTQDGEMEAWTLSTRSHAQRFRSFAELMQDLATIDADPHNAESALVVEGVYARSPCARLLSTAATR